MQRSITYLPVKSKDDVTHLRVDVYYSQGGYNLSTYQEEQRGYYLSVSPVSRSKLGDANTERYGTHYLKGLDTSPSCWLVRHFD